MRIWTTIKIFQEILFDFHEGIARITINRPRYRNAFTPLTVSEMSQAFAICREDQISCYSPTTQRLIDLPLYGISPEQVAALLDNGDGSFSLLLTSGERMRLTLQNKGNDCSIQIETQSFHPQGLLAVNQKEGYLYFVDESEQLHRCTTEGKEKTWIANLKGMREKYGEIVSIDPFQSSIYVAFRLGKIIDVHQPTDPIDVGLGIFWSMVDQQQEIYHS